MFDIRYIYNDCFKLNLHVYLPIFHRDDFHDNTVIKMKRNYKLFMIGNKYIE